MLCSCELSIWLRVWLFVGVFEVVNGVIGRNYLYYFNMLYVKIEHDVGCIVK